MPRRNEIDFIGIHFPPSLLSVDEIRIDVGVLPVYRQVGVNEPLMRLHTLLGGCLERLALLPLHGGIIIRVIPGACKRRARQDDYQSDRISFHSSSIIWEIDRMP